MTTASITIVMFLLLITIHEFGHFIAAKSTGIKVLEFAIGMGPAILKKQKGETLYTLRALPIGGYCKMEGEDTESDADDAYCAQPLWKRMIVVIAGAFLNIVLGFVLFIVIASNSPSYTTNVIDKIDPNSYLADVGVQPGDEIVNINGENIGFYQDIAFSLNSIAGDKPIDIKVKRNGEKIGFSVMPSKQIVKVKYTDTGIEIIQYMNEHEESKFVEYNEENSFDESKIGTVETSERYLIGFTPATEEKNIVNTISQAFNYTRFVVKVVYKSLFQMITGDVSFNEVSGPIGVVKEVNTAVSNGWIYVVNLIALITINLGVFNLLPLPALDGGRLFFMIIELIRRKPIPPEKEGMIHAIGLVLLLILMVFVFYNDIMKLI